MACSCCPDNISSTDGRALSVRRFVKALGGLQFKCTLACVALVIIASFLGLALQMRLSAKAMLNQLELRARGLSLGLTASALHSLQSQNQRGLSELVKDFANHVGVMEVAIVRDDNQLAAGYGRFGGKLQRMEGESITGKAAVLGKCLSGGQDAVTRVGKQGVGAAAAIIDPRSGEKIGWSYVDLSMVDYRAEILEIRKRMVVVFELILVATVPIVFVMVRRFVGPINAVAQAAKLVAAGHLGQTITISRSDEVGQLADAFNQMTGKLAASQRELLELNSKLEQKVFERTAQLLESNERLSQAAKERDAFYGAISHDLGAPLNNIAGLVKLIINRHGEQLPEKLMDRLNLIEKTSNQANDLLEKLTELSKIRTVQQKWQQVDLNELVQQLLDQFEYSIDKAAIQVELVAKLPVVYAEPARLRQLFQNLIDNAIKYIGSGQVKLITIGYRDWKRFHEFYVSDTGVGIDPAEREKIFYVFHRCKSPTGVDVSGTGVGLASCKTIVEHYGGKIWVESQLGSGSTFRFTLDKRVVGKGDIANQQRCDAGQPLAVC